MAQQVTLWKADCGSLHQTRAEAHLADAADALYRRLEGDLGPDHRELALQVSDPKIGVPFALAILEMLAPHRLAQSYRVETSPAGPG